MPLTGEEIRQRLVAFGEKWSFYQGTERSGAQLFLNELFACYGQDLQSCGALLEEAQHGKFLDLIWPRVCLIEMKRPSQAANLAAHRPQALDYWKGAADPEHNIPAPRWVVLCAFHRFEVWEPGTYPNEPRLVFDLAELPDQVDALMFLAGREPVFVGTQAAVTRETVKLITRPLPAPRGPRRRRSRRTARLPSPVRVVHVRRGSRPTGGAPLHAARRRPSGQPAAQESRRSQPSCVRRDAIGCFARKLDRLPGGGGGRTIRLVPG